MWVSISMNNKKIERFKKTYSRLFKTVYSYLLNEQRTLSTHIPATISQQQEDSKLSLVSVSAKVR